MTLLEFPTQTLINWKKLAVAIEAARETDSYSEAIAGLVLRVQLLASLRDPKPLRSAVFASKGGASRRRASK